MVQHENRMYQQGPFFPIINLQSSCLMPSMGDLWRLGCPANADRAIVLLQFKLAQIAILLVHIFF